MGNFGIIVGDEIVTSEGIFVWVGSGVIDLDAWLVGVLQAVTNEIMITINL
jgi:hypothetical protein